MLVIGGAEFAGPRFEMPAYIFPPPSADRRYALDTFPTFHSGPHIGVTLTELFVGFAIGASIGSCSPR